MCSFCNSKNNGNSCYANFSAPRCNRITPRTKRYLENDLSAYQGRNSCNCYCNCCADCATPYQTANNYGDDCYDETYPYAKPHCDIPKDECCF